MQNSNEILILYDREGLEPWLASLVSKIKKLLYTLCTVLYNIIPTPLVWIQVAALGGHMVEGEGAVCDH